MLRDEFAEESDWRLMYWRLGNDNELVFMNPSYGGKEFLKPNMRRFFPLREICSERSNEE